MSQNSRVCHLVVLNVGLSCDTIIFKLIFMKMRKMIKKSKWVTQTNVKWRSWNPNFILLSGKSDNNEKK